MLAVGKGPDWFKQKMYTGSLEKQRLGFRRLQLRDGEKMRMRERERGHSE